MIRGQCKESEEVEEGGWESRRGKGSRITGKRGHFSRVDPRDSSVAQVSPLSVSVWGGV